MRVPHITNSTEKVQLSRISHVYFEQPDLNTFAQFAEAFGFVEAHREDDTVYYRGYGRDQYIYVVSQSTDGQKRFKGAAFIAATEADFDKAAKLPQAQVQDLKAPGGGRLVTIERPGPTHLHVMYGQTERDVPQEPPSATHEDQGPYNKSLTKPRKGTTSFVSIVPTS